MMGQVLLRRGAGLSDQPRLKGGGLQSVRQSQNIYQSQISIVLALYWHYAGIVLTLRRCRAARGVWRRRMCQVVTSRQRHSDYDGPISDIIRMNLKPSSTLAPSRSNRF